MDQGTLIVIAIGAVLVIGIASIVMLGRNAANSNIAEIDSKSTSGVSAEAQAVEAGVQDPCTLSIVTAKGEEQSWPCHARCFRLRLADLPYSDAIICDEDV